MGMNRSTLAYLTPPAMAPGVVAYGEFSVPYISQDQLTGGVLGAYLRPVADRYLA